MILALLAACIENGFTEIQTLDLFQQERRQAVDLLIVVDNSCSMVEEQDKLSRNFEALIAEMSSADVEWQIAVSTTDIEDERHRGRLRGGDDEIVLRGPSGEIDRVAWTPEWGFTPGVALALDGEKLAFSANDSPLNWCPATTDYAGGRLGTPGAPNPTCAGAPTSPSPGVDAGPRAPAAGDLVITEILSMAGGGDPDSRCEWFEITSTTDDTLTLDGLIIEDLGNNHVEFPAVTLPPRGALVVGRALSDNCGAPVDVAFPTGFVLNDDARVIDRDTPDVADLFAELVAVGSSGTGIEMGLEGARLVFEPENAERNGAFLREDANLAILFVSDEDDLSPYPIDAYLRYFMGLKGDRAFRDPRWVSLSAVVAEEPPPRADLPSCESENGGTAWYGERYLEITGRSGGLVESICEEDFAPIVRRLGLTLSGLLVEFQLSECPNLDTLVVELFSARSQDSLVRELVRDEDFTYDFGRNSLVFSHEQVPPSEHFVTAEYIALRNAGCGEAR